jgi:hypothetical protein
MILRKKDLLLLIDLLLVVLLMSLFYTGALRTFASLGILLSFAVASSLGLHLPHHLLLLKHLHMLLLLEVNYSLVIVFTSIFNLHVVVILLLQLLLLIKIFSILLIILLKLSIVLISDELAASYDLMSVSGSSILKNHFLAIDILDRLLVVSSCILLLLLVEHVILNDFFWEGELVRVLLILLPKIFK